MLLARQRVHRYSISASCYRIRQFAFKQSGFRIKYDDPTFSGFCLALSSINFLLFLAVALPVHFPMHYTDSISLLSDKSTVPSYIVVPSFTRITRVRVSMIPVTVNIFILRNHLYFRHPVLSHVLQKFRYRQHWYLRICDNLSASLLLSIQLHIPLG